MVYIIFAMNFIIVNAIFAYQLFKKSLNKCLFGKNNTANMQSSVI